MTSNYPTSLDTFVNPTATDPLNSVTVPHASQHDNINDAVLAIETELGTDPSGSSATVKARLDGFNPTAGTLVASASIAGSSNAGAISYGTLSYSDTGHYLTLQSNLNSYTQMEIQNTNNGTSASADVIVANDTTTAGSNYGDLGINSSTFSGTGSLATPNATYLYANGGELAIGTTSANGIHLVVNNGATDAVAISSGGTTTFKAGTATAAPIDMTAGTNLTAPNGGALEYDGKAPYFTPDTSAVGGRGVLDVSLFASVAGTAKSLNSATGNQAIFATPTTGAVTLAGGTSYLFEGLVMLATGAITHTTSFNFGGTATFTSCHISTIYQSSTGATGTTASFAYFTTATGGVMSATATTAGAQFLVKGLMRVNASGTVIPQLAFSAAPTGTNTVLIDSYMRFIPIGSNTVVSSGAWA